MADFQSILSKESPEIQNKFNAIRAIGQECVEDLELLKLLKTKQNIMAYDGFEPSGNMHIAQAVLKSHIIKTMCANGCTFTLWVADWFAKMNLKCDGDMNKIHRVGEYFVEVWKALGVGTSPETEGKVLFRWCGEEIASNVAYWELVMDIARTFSLTRVTRCSQIMGRKDEDLLTGSQIWYPCMQCADIFFLGVNICQLGVDQRKVNMLCREYCDIKKLDLKPVILSHHMLMGLSEGQGKMSKSDPNSAIYVDDDEATVNAKIGKAFMPEGTVENSPLFNWLQHLILPVLGHLQVGASDYKTFEEVRTAVAAGTFEFDKFKPAMAAQINGLISPIRNHFISSPEMIQLRADVNKISEENRAKKKLTDEAVASSASSSSSSAADSSANSQGHHQ